MYNQDQFEMKDKTAKHTSMWFMECMTRRPCDCTLMHGVKRAGERTCWGNSQPHYISQQYVIEWFSDILVPRAFSLLGGWGREKALGRRMVLRYPALLASCETPGDVINRPIFRTTTSTKLEYAYQKIKMPPQEGLHQDISIWQKCDATLLNRLMKLSKMVKEIHKISSS